MEKAQSKSKNALHASLAAAFTAFKAQLEADQATFDSLTLR
jgi:hypothetical protein